MLSLFCSLSSGHKHEEGIQELYYTGPAGFVQEQHSESSGWDAQQQRQASSPQQPHFLQVLHKNCDIWVGYIISQASRFMWDVVFLNTGRIPLTRWNSTQTRLTFLTCGGRKCSRTRRKRGEKGGGRGWEHSPATALCFFVFILADFFLYLFIIYELFSPSSRNRRGAWKAAPFSARWRRWERLETEGKSGTWWRSIRSFAQITAIRKRYAEGHRPRAHCPRMAGKGSLFLCFFWVQMQQICF